MSGRLERADNRLRIQPKAYADVQEGCLNLLNSGMLEL